MLFESFLVLMMFPPFLLPNYNACGSGSRSRWHRDRFTPFSGPIRQSLVCPTPPPAVYNAIDVSMDTMLLFVVTDLIR
uniref:Putative secreted protein n=1 Tax=Anopheles darlingi TaxID=43151 RepID=A0A2M4DAM2_ANODA